MSIDTVNPFDEPMSSPRLYSDSIESYRVADLKVSALLDAAVPTVEAAAPSPIPFVEDSYKATVEAYQAHMDAVARLSLEEIALTDAKVTLERQRAFVLTSYDPKALGSNEEQRKAAIAEKTHAEAEQVRLHGRSVELLKAEAEIARIRCRLCDQTVKHIEIAQDDKALESYNFEE